MWTEGEFAVGGCFLDGEPGVELADGFDRGVVCGFEIGLQMFVFDGGEDGGDIFGEEIGEAADGAVADFDRGFGERELEVRFYLLQDARDVAGEFGVRRDARFEGRVFAGDVDVGVEGVGVPEGGGVGLVGDFEPEEVAVDLGD